MSKPGGYSEKLTKEQERLFYQSQGINLTCTHLVWTPIFHSRKFSGYNLDARLLSVLYEALYTPSKFFYVLEAAALSTSVIALSVWPFCPSAGDWARAFPMLGRHPSHPTLPRSNSSLCSLLTFAIPLFLWYCALLFVLSASWRWFQVARPSGHLWPLPGSHGTMTFSSYHSVFQSYFKSCVLCKEVDFLKMVNHFIFELRTFAPVFNTERACSCWMDWLTGDRQMGRNQPASLAGDFSGKICRIEVLDWVKIFSLRHRGKENTGLGPKKPKGGNLGLLSDSHVVVQFTIWQDLGIPNNRHMVSQSGKYGDSQWVREKPRDPTHFLKTT